MPTPFSHLEINQRLLNDPLIPDDARQFIKSHLAAFSLGGVAADARVGSGMERSATHFYDYREKIICKPWRVMVRQFPKLLTPNDADHRAFVAAYVAHLSVDERWTLRMVRPHFGRREWAVRDERFFMLHILMTIMDERDFDRLDAWVSDCLKAARPIHWLPFIDDMHLIEWRDLIHRQFTPNGPTETLQIFSQRIDRPIKEMRTILDSPEQMQRRLWQFVSQAFLQRVEAECYAYARAQMMVYLNLTAT